MKQEDKQFLAELAHELNTQDNCATRNPVWCIMDKEFRINNEGGFECKVIDSDGNMYNREEFADCILEDYELKEEDDVVIDYIIDYITSCDDTDELRDYLEETFEDIDPNDYTIVYGDYEDIVKENATAFLTKKSAEEHLKANYYHYSKFARAYALSAWRNPVYERLINIIKETKWEDEV